MRHFSVLVLVLACILGCSDDPEVKRTDFAEVTVEGKKFTFSRLEATVNDNGSISCEVMFEDPKTNSYLNFLTTSHDRLWNEYKSGGFTPKIEWLHLQSYDNRVPGTYSLSVYLMTVKIDKDKDGRIHGSLSGKLECSTCLPGDEIVWVTGEFELPYTNQD